MADISSSLPVRTESPGDVVAKIADATVPSQQLAVDASGRIVTKIEDSSGGTLNSTSNALNVFVTNTLPVTIGSPDESAFTYGTTAQQTIGGVFQDTSPTLSAGQQGAVRLTQNRGMHVNLRTAAGAELGNSAADKLFVQPTDGTNSQAYTASGEAKVDITSSITLTTTSTNLPATVDTNYGTVGASTIRSAAQIGNALGAADFNAGATGAQTLRVVANQGAANSTPWNENIAQIAGAVPSATNALPTQIATAGAFVSSSNPLPVVIDPAGAGTAVNDYKDASAIAAGSSDNHDYTVTAGKTLHLQGVRSSSSGKAKMLLAIETAVASGIFTPINAQFNSTATPNMNVDFPSTPLVAAGVRVRVTMSNRDLLADDLYSTICGFEI